MNPFVRAEWPSGSQTGGNKDCALMKIAKDTEAVLEYKLQIGLIGTFCRDSFPVRLEEVA